MPLSVGVSVGGVARSARRSEVAMVDIVDLAPRRAERLRREAEAEMEAVLRRFVEDDEFKIDCRAFVPTHEIASRRF